MDPLWVKEARRFEEQFHYASYGLYEKKGIEDQLTMRSNWIKH